MVHHPRKSYASADPDAYGLEEDSAETALDPLQARGLDAMRFRAVEMRHAQFGAPEDRMLASQRPRPRRYTPRTQRALNPTWQVVSRVISRLYAAEDDLGLIVASHIVTRDARSIHQLAQDKDLDPRALYAANTRVRQMIDEELRTKR